MATPASDGGSRTAAISRAPEGGGDGGDPGGGGGQLRVRRRSPAQRLRQGLAPRSAACSTYAEDIDVVTTARRPWLMAPAVNIRNVDCHAAETLVNVATCTAYEWAARVAAQKCADARGLGDSAAESRLRPVAPTIRAAGAIAALYHCSGQSTYKHREKLRRLDLISGAHERESSPVCPLALACADSPRARRARSFLWYVRSRRLEQWPRLRPLGHTRLGRARAGYRRCALRRMRRCTSQWP